MLGIKITERSGGKITGINVRTKCNQSRRVCSNETDSSRRLHTNETQVQTNASTRSNLNTHRNQSRQVLPDSKHRHKQENKALEQSISY